MGYRDDDLYIRWLQFGMFSPIMRLHSTAWELLGKEPWKYRAEVHNCARKWLNLRHRLIPYIFTMDYRTHTQGIALCEPMYYSYPENPNAYKVPNQYMFGSELMVCPITKKQDQTINMGSVKAWLPAGRWVDIFTGKAYRGGQNMELFRELDTIPVLAKEGAIIPLSADQGNRVDNPANFEIWAFSGDGSFTMVEDNGRTDYNDHKAVTTFEMKYANDSMTFTINKAQGDISVIPSERNYKIIVKDLIIDGEPVVIEFNDCSVSKSYSKTIDGVKRSEWAEPRDEVIRIMSRWQAQNFVKNKAYSKLESLKGRDEILREIHSVKMPECVKKAIIEMVD